MPLTLIQVPYHLGHAGVGVGAGPAAFIAGGAARYLSQRGEDVRVESVPAGLRPAAEELEGITAVNAALARLVRDALDAGRFPLVLAGDCNSALGTLAALGAPPPAVLWFDAHGDVNTPETSPSGFFDGMALAIACGRCHEELRLALGAAEPVPESQVVLAGVRDLDPGERRFLARSRTRVADAESLASADGERMLPSLYPTLAPGVRDAYLHIDLDVLDPQTAPGVGFASPSGLSVEDVEREIAELSHHFRICAAALTNHAPARDEGDMTVRAGLRLMAAIAEAARG